MFFSFAYLPLEPPYFWIMGQALYRTPNSTLRHVAGLFSCCHYAYYIALPDGAISNQPIEFEGGNNECSFFHLGCVPLLSH